MLTIVVATHNRGKLEQFKLLFGGLCKNVQLLSLGDINYHKDIVEDGVTYAENSLIKAKTVCEETGYVALGEDSGLNIDALPQMLGLYTARFKKELTQQQRLELVLEKMKGLPTQKRTARFTSVVTCVFPSGEIIAAEGVLEGFISEKIVNLTSMAYQPIFIPAGTNKTLSVLSSEELVAVNHRGIATRALIEKLKDSGKI